MCPETVCSILKSRCDPAFGAGGVVSAISDVVLVDCADSTQSVAAALARAGAASGTVVIARTQTCGRGRMGRQWLSPQGGLYASVVLRPALPVERWPGLTVHAGIAVVLHARASGVLHAVLKWPNDCLVDGRKLCGLLAESFPSEGFVVVGFGMNVEWSDELERTGILDGGYDATALTLLTSAEPDGFCADLVEAVFNALERADRGLPVDSNEARRILWTTGPVAVDCGDVCQVGDVAGIDLEGRLMLRLSDGHMAAVSCGEVRHARCC